MTTAQQSRLTGLNRIYHQLRHQARRHPGETQRASLPRGARLSLTINGNQHILVFSRQGKPVGDVELVTFYGHCDVPPHARRVPEMGQTVRDGWHLVGYVWEEESL